jgi:hypothetical protein
MSNDILAQVREMLDRTRDPFEIAHKLHIDLEFVQQAMSILLNKVLA